MKKTEVIYYTQRKNDLHSLGQSYIIFKTKGICPRSIMDNTQASGACDAGSIPVEGTISKNNPCIVRDCTL